jgi:putative restriction endonuclease
MTVSRRHSSQVKNWTKGETMMAFALYKLLQTSEHDAKNDDVIRLARSLSRTPAAVALKIQNIAAHDPDGKHRGLVHGSKYDESIWGDYFKNPDGFLNKCLDVMSMRINGHPSESFESLDSEAQSTPVGRDLPLEATQRYGQSALRNVLLKNYHARCCLTGIDIKELLVVSHIKPWSVSEPTEKVSASNALLLNAFHDRAFDKGLITINQQLKVVVWDELEHSKLNDKWLYSYEGKRISVPEAGVPDREYVTYHNKNIFKKPSQLQ